MSQIAIVYWSGTGNTEAMAELIADAVREKGGTADLITADAFDAARVEDYDALAFGCPSMGVEELEEDEFAPMFEAVETSLSGRRIALFGSYGWGDGEWMRNWEARCRDLGCDLVADPVICEESPDAEAEAACQALGHALIG